MLLLISCFAFQASAADNNGGTSTLASCAHDFVCSGEYHSGNNEHTYRCTKCTAYQVEPCYNDSPCVNYKNQETLKCEVCNKGTVYIHNYVCKHPTNDTQKRHIDTCINDYSAMGYMYGLCGKTSGSYVSCTLQAKQVWRGWISGKGHFITQTCSICENQYTVAYLQPAGHPDYFDPDNDCEYCQMGSPYFKPLT